MMEKKKHTHKSTLRETHSIRMLERPTDSYFIPQSVELFDPQVVAFLDL